MHHAFGPDDVESESTDDEGDERCGLIAHLIYRSWPLSRSRQSREFTRCQDNLVVDSMHSEDELALPNLLENASRLGRHQVADASKESEGDSLIGEFLVVDGVEWWRVTRANTDGTYEIHHDSENLSRAFVPRKVVESGIYQQHQQNNSTRALAHANLPAWAIHPDATPCLPRSVGPIIPLARTTVVGMLITQLVLLVVSLASSSYSGNGLAVYPGWIIPAMLPVNVLRAIVEWRILKPALINFQHIGFHMFGIMEVAFVVWLVYVFSFSQLSFSDLCTDSLFTGQTLRSIASDDMFDKIWHEAWQMSMMKWVRTPSLSAMLGIAWLLSTLQIVWPFLWSFRRSDLQGTTRHEPGSCGVSPSVTSLWRSEAAPVSNLWHSDVLFALADAGGLSSLQSMSIPRFANAHKKAQADILSDSTCTLLRGTEVFADIIVERIFLSYILENCIQVNLQATIYAIVIASCRLRGAEEEFQGRALFSIVIGITSSLLKLAEVYSFNKVVISASELAARFDSDEQVQTLNRHIQHRGWLARLGAFILVLSICYASARIAMAHVCEDAVWNLNGCASLRPR